MRQVERHAKSDPSAEQRGKLLETRGNYWKREDLAAFAVDTVEQSAPNVTADVGPDSRSPIQLLRRVRHAGTPRHSPSLCCNHAWVDPPPPLWSPSPSGWKRSEA